MNHRTATTALLLLIVFGSLAVFAWRHLRPTPATAAATTDAAAARREAAATVLVTYFTTDVRCDSCRTIEALTQRAVQEGFRDELAAGQVVFRVVNTDRPEHRHFVDHYEIANKTVIVSHQRQGHEVAWTGRQDVWLHFEEPETFFAYVREPIRAYLTAK